MSFLEVHGAQATGILPLQHRAFNKPSGGQPPWDLDYRAHKRCVRVVARKDTAGGIGHWIPDKESEGDLMLGLCWPPEGGKRPFPAWSFGFGVVIAAYGGRSNDVATGGGRQAAGARGDMFVRAVGDRGYGPDMRLVPIGVPAWRFVGRGGGGGGGGGRQGAAGPGQGPRGNTLFLGIGARVHPVGGGGFVTFQGVRTNFSSGSARAGGTFTPQPEGRRRPVLF